MEFVSYVAGTYVSSISFYDESVLSYWSCRRKYLTEHRKDGRCLRYVENILS
jgi:hypothetical protein